jgi:hypothetical protein
MGCPAAGRDLLGRWARGAPESCPAWAVSWGACSQVVAPLPQQHPRSCAAFDVLMPMRCTIRGGHESGGCSPQRSTHFKSRRCSCRPAAIPAATKFSQAHKFKSGCSFAVKCRHRSPCATAERVQATPPIRQRRCRQFIHGTNARSATTSVRAPVTGGRALLMCARPRLSHGPTCSHPHRNVPAERQCSQVPPAPARGLQHGHQPQQRRRGALRCGGLLGLHLHAPPVAPRPTPPHPTPPQLRLTGHLPSPAPQPLPRGGWPCVLRTGGTFLAALCWCGCRRRACQIPTCPPGCVTPPRPSPVTRWQQQRQLRDLPAIWEVQAAGRAAGLPARRRQRKQARARLEAGACRTPQMSSAGARG